MIIQNDTQVTEAVLHAAAGTDNTRQRDLLTALVKHLHAFVREVNLTEAEFREATAIINAIGQTTTDTHNEAVLLAGSLGVSQLVCLLNNAKPGTADTTQSLLGPFWRAHSPQTDNGASLLRSPTPGHPLYVEFSFVDQMGRPIDEAQVDVWHCSSQGLYENQDDAQTSMNLRGKFTSNTQGRVWFTTIKPSGYPIPTHTLAGRLADLQGRHPNRPAHVHALAYKPGYKTLISQIYADDDPHLDSDVQFGVTEKLVGHFQHHDTPHPDGNAQGDWYSLTHTLVMHPGDAAWPAPPIR